MANILEQNGIKEVADVTLYSISTDVSGQVVYTPELFLDTLKVSTIEQTAEQSEARGGKGNSPLIIWDYGKEIKVTLEDALFTPKSMAVMFGTGTVANITKTKKMSKIKLAADVAIIPEGTKYYSTADMSPITVTADLKAGTLVYEEKEVTVTSGSKIEVNADSFPGTYKLVGDTYARNKNTGEDEYFQFIIHQAKMGAENTITLEAEGDPTVFNMTMRVLRPETGPMMELIKYNV